MNRARFKSVAGPLLAAILFSIVALLSPEWGGHTYVEFSMTLRVTYHALWWLSVIAFTVSALMVRRDDPAKGEIPSPGRPDERPLLKTALFWLGHGLQLAGGCILLFAHSGSRWKALFDSLL